MSKTRPARAGNRLAWLRRSWKLTGSVLAALAALVAVISFVLSAVAGSAATSDTGPGVSSGLGLTGPPHIETGGRPATVRATPHLDGKRVGQVANKTRVAIVCTAQGDAVDGYLGPSSTWDWIRVRRADHLLQGYVSDSLVYTGTTQPTKPACRPTVKTS